MELHKYLITIKPFGKFMYYNNYYDSPMLDTNANAHPATLARTVKSILDPHVCWTCKIPAKTMVCARKTVGATIDARVCPISPEPIAKRKSIYILSARNTAWTMPHVGWLLRPVRCSAFASRVLPVLDVRSIPTIVLRSHAWTTGSASIRWTVSGATAREPDTRERCARTMWTNAQWAWCVCTVAFVTIRMDRLFAHVHRDTEAIVVSIRSTSVRRSLVDQELHAWISIMDGLNVFVQMELWIRLVRKSTYF